MSSTAGRLRNLLTRLSGGLRERRRPGRGARTPTGSTRPRTRPSAPATDYPGDFVGVSTVLYDPIEDPYADPGEIVWTRVVFEEDARQGKDRPVLVVGRDGRWLLALMLTSKDHDATTGPGNRPLDHSHADPARAERAAQARRGRVWLDLGTGDWDTRRRPSEVRIDRVLRIDPDRVRRTGATLDRQRFDRVAAEVRRVDGWS